MKQNKIITVIGLGYVGTSMSVLLSQYNKVQAVDIDTKKVEMINNKISPVKDEQIQLYLDTMPLDLKATTDLGDAHKNTDIYIIATPTNYDEDIKFFDTISVEQTIKNINLVNPEACIIIKSTIPIGFTAKLQKKYPSNIIIFSPEFLREGRALYDNLYPSRIVIGSKLNEGKEFANLLLESSKKEQENIPVIFSGSNEAEAIKLFSNTYLAMRVAYFNELDSYSERNNLNTKEIIDGVCSDDRIGDHYNNPSFGYGGYCLPKDTKQLLQNFDGIPNNIIQSIVDANETRKEYIANLILKKNPSTVGVYRLIMKQGSDNFRASSIIDVMNKIGSNGIKIIIFEPSVKEKTFNNFEVSNDLNYFKSCSDCIITNRIDGELKDVMHKVFSRDLYGDN